jgi:hypothetical protein
METHDFPTQSTTPRDRDEFEPFRDPWEPDTWDDDEPQPAPGDFWLDGDDQDD